MKALLKAAIPVAAALSLYSYTANAAVVTFDLSLPAITNAGLAPSSTVPTVNLDLTASVNGQYRSPWQGTAADGSTYHSVQGDASATYDFGANKSVFSMVWGSPDDYNTLELKLNGAVVFTMIGETDTDTIWPIVGGSGLDFAVVTITDVVFDQAVLSSVRNAFEYAQVSAVPLPAAAWLFGSALVGLGVLTRKKA